MLQVILSSAMNTIVKHLDVCLNFIIQKRYSFSIPVIVIYQRVFTQSLTGSSSDSTQQDSTDRQDSTESNDIAAALLNQPPMPQRPSIVLDSSQLPIQREMQKADSTNSLHMQSETMC
jgi:hypothetical protein